MSPYPFATSVRISTSDSNNGPSAPTPTPTPPPPNTHNNDVIIESITCPITGSVMTEPVCTPSGHTYERSAITEWLQRNPTSPQSRRSLRVEDLKNNTSILYLCDKYNSGQLTGTVQPRPPPKISSDHIKLIHYYSTDADNKHLMLSFNIDSESFPKEVPHLSQDVILVIDRSGSMQANVEAKDSDGNALENGFSVQDIVNHAAKTVAKTLDSNSRLAVIAFDNNIIISYDLKIMTDMNKTLAVSTIDNIKPGGQTNIYGALEKAIEILDTREDKSRNSAILMLTDGVPNIEPARGTVPTLQKLRVKKNFTAPIYTFGFGYHLQRELLYDIAKYANGANGHIPDGGMIATVFCNFIATILSTVVMNLQLHIVGSNINLMGDYAYNIDTEKNTIIYDLGTVQYQQSRDIILKLDGLEDIQYYFTYKIGGASYKTDDFKYSTKNITISPIFNDNLYRYHLIEGIRCMINYGRSNDFPNATLVFDQINNSLKSLPQTPLINGMIKNLSGDGSNEGQIKLAATNPQYFKRWGEFYLDQLSRALQQQIKPNFKDDACMFGGEVFDDIVDKASDIFDTLPAPTPSNINRTPSYSGSTYRGLSSAPSTQPVNMSAYNDPGGGCFTGDAKILLADKTQKYVKDLIKGDTVLSLIDPYDPKKGFATANVVCILKTITNGNAKLVTTPKGLKITPWHPIISHGTWCHPQSVYVTSEENCHAVYTILLDNYHTFNLNGSWVIGLAHNYMVGILPHEYFGTNKIISDLINHPDWETGLVTINYKQFIRHPITKEICNINVTNYNVNSNINYTQKPITVI
tara:strand:+ start:434 stop:2854 length:2421 start_codon:yes stop_codon:yes gene_type:complete